MGFPPSNQSGEGGVEGIRDGNFGLEIMLARILRLCPSELSRMLVMVDAIDSESAHQVSCLLALHPTCSNCPRVYHSRIARILQ